VDLNENRKLCTLREKQ